MTTPKSATELSDNIEELIEAYIAEAHKSAQDALRRAFVGTGSPAMPSVKAPAATKSTGRRRSSQEILDLSERLFGQVTAQPGSPMAVFAEVMNKSPRSLHRPMAMLKRAGRVRSVGERQFTRYYPRPSAGE